MGEYGESRLTNNLDYAEHMYKKGRVTNIRGYTIKVIKENAKLQKSLFDTEKQEAKEAKKNEERKKRQKNKDNFSIVTIGTLK
jgi:hypothetical protein